MYYGFVPWNESQTLIISICLKVLYMKESLIPILYAFKIVP